MFINIIGAIIYFLGVFFTLAWGVNLRYRAKTAIAWGITLRQYRVKMGERERVFEVLGLLIAISLILIPTLSLSPFHLLWMFPISFLLAPLSILFPLNLLLWPLAYLYTSFWYIGLSDEEYKGGLLSRVKNKHSGKRYIIGTAQEIGKDYWTTVVLPARFFGLLPDGFKPLLTWVRNNKEEAHEVHWMIKKIVAEEPEDKWIEVAPSPIPPDGYSEDAKKTFKEKLGFIPRYVQLLEKKMNQNNLIDLIDYFRLKNWIEEKTKLEEKFKKEEFLTKLQEDLKEKYGFVPGEKVAPEIENLFNYFINDNQSKDLMSNIENILNRKLNSNEQFVIGLYLDYFILGNLNHRFTGKIFKISDNEDQKITLFHQLVYKNREYLFKQICNLIKESIDEEKIQYLGEIIKKLASNQQELITSCDTMSFTHKLRKIFLDLLIQEPLLNRVLSSENKSQRNLVLSSINLKFDNVIKEIEKKIQEIDLEKLK
jgi:hypothetical protein